MEIRIEDLQSTIRSTGSGALLDPVVLEQIVEVVLGRVREDLDHERRVAGERRLGRADGGDAVARETR